MGSLGKILLFVLVIVVLWFGWRYFRIREKELDIAAEKAKSKDVAKAEIDATAQTMVSCPVCKTFVAQGAAACFRPGCPQGR
jgi:predicted negative regulator of RcsB-dependent stress response